MSALQFVAVKFRPGDSRTYTYQWDGEPLAPGDEVKVPDNQSDGWKRVTVVSVSDQAPPFACKWILGRAPSADQERDDKLTAIPAAPAYGDGPLF
jgi:hypothetical protein